MPGNVLIDALMQRWYEVEFDKDGKRVNFSIVDMIKMRVSYCTVYRHWMAVSVNLFSMLS